MRIHLAAALIILSLPGLVLAWTGPTAAPPSNNVSAPLNVGTIDQVKNASIGVNGLAVFGNGIFSGTNRYLNFGTISGTTGYGMRDNAGTLEFKNLGGSWASLQSIVYTLGGGGWTTSGNNIYNSNTGNVGIGTQSPDQKLDVNGSVKIGNGGGSCTAAAAGTVRYNSTSNVMEYCNGTSWAAFGNVAANPATVSCRVCVTVRTAVNGNWDWAPESCSNYSSGNTKQTVTGISDGYNMSNVQVGIQCQ